MGEQKIVRGVWVTWPRWPPRPYVVKTLKKSSSSELKSQWPCDLVCSTGALDPSWLIQMMTLGWPWPILRQGQIWSFMLLYGGNCQKAFNEKTYNKWPEWQKVNVYIKIQIQRGCLPCPGLYTCIKTWRNMYKIRLQRYLFWNLQQMSKVIMFFCWHQDFVHKRLSIPAPGLYKCEKKTLQNVYKIRIQRDLFETCNKWSQW